MPASLIETKRRIVTIQSTEKITKAMKLVSSVKFQKWKKMYDENSNYTSKMRDIFIRTYLGVDLKQNSLNRYLKSFSQTKNLYVVVSSTLGLCGSYNYNVFKKLDSILKKEDEILVIGQKGLLHYRNYSNKIYDTFVNLFDNFSYNNVKLLRHYLFNIYKDQTYHSISLCYTNYKNSINFSPVIETFAPFTISFIENEGKESYPPIFAPNAETVCNLIFPYYADSLLYNRLISAALSEHASRRNAMESASKNANDIVSDLILVYNKSRQEQITQEITEVASAANV